MTRCITKTACKFILKIAVEYFEKNGTQIQKSPMEIADEYDLWMVDEWTMLGHIIIVCLDNSKLIESFVKGNAKVLDSLLGKIMKASNYTVDPEYVKEILPLAIEKWFINELC